MCQKLGPSEDRPFTSGYLGNLGRCRLWHDLSKYQHVSDDFLANKKTNKQQKKQPVVATVSFGSAPHTDYGLSQLLWKTVWMFLKIYYHILQQS